MTLFEKLQSPGEVAAEQSFSKLLDCSLKRCSKWTTKWMNFLEMTPGCCSSKYWRGSALSRFSTQNLYGIIGARRKLSQSDKNFARICRLIDRESDDVLNEVENFTIRISISIFLPFVPGQVLNCRLSSCEQERPTSLYPFIADNAFY